MVNEIVQKDGVEKNTGSKTEAQESLIFKRQKKKVFVLAESIGS